MKRRTWLSLGLAAGVLLLLSPVFALLLHVLTIQQVADSGASSPSQLAEAMSRNAMIVVKSLGSGLLGLVLTAICAWQLLRTSRPDERT